MESGKAVRYLSEEIYERAELSGEESEDREVATCLRLFSQASLMPSPTRTILGKTYHSVKRPA